MVQAKLRSIDISWSAVTRAGIVASVLALVAGIAACSTSDTGGAGGGGAGRFSPAGAMAEGRSGHAATSLSSGKVLVVGGSGKYGGLASAEVYDPATGKFSPTGDMTVPRASHTTTLLPSGKVLVAGSTGLGTVESSPVSSAEVYDPAAGTFSATGSMSTERAGHTATLLPSGKVLVAGSVKWMTTISSAGSGANDPASADLYDPATGMFSPTGSMMTARGGHAAALLGSGKVLIVGGAGVSGRLASAELYDPASGMFSPTGSMATAREGATATALPGGKVLVAGGAGDKGDVASAELYDAATGTFSQTGSMAIARSYHTATLIPSSGKVLIVGGAGAPELYDPATGTFSRTGALATARLGHTATLLPGDKVLVAGGVAVDDLSVDLASAEVYR